MFSKSSPRLYSRIIFIFFILVFGFFSAINSVDVQTADLAFETNLNPTEQKENFYASGGMVNITQNTRKDLTVAGGNVRLSGSVERNLTVVGSDVEVNAPLVSGSTKIVAGRVKLSGVFKEDVVILAGQLDISSATIQGDLILNVGNLKLRDSYIGGNLIGTYNTSDGDLRPQVKGNLDLRRQAQKIPSLQDILNYTNPAAEISVIVALAGISYFLYIKKRLLMRTVKLDREIGFDLLAGLLYLVLPVILLVISFVFQLYPLVLTIGALIYLLFALSSVFLPIYTASFLKNIWLKKIDLRILVAGSYIFLLSLNIISKVVPFLDFLQIIIFIAAMANFGFLMRRLLSIVHDYLNLD